MGMLMLAFTPSVLVPVSFLMCRAGIFGGCIATRHECNSGFYSYFLQEFSQLVIGNLLPVKLNVYPPGRTGIGLKNAGFSTKRIGHHARMTLMANAISIPKYMTKPCRYSGTGGLHDLPDAGQRQGLRVIVDAQLCGFLIGRRSQMNIFDA